MTDSQPNPTAQKPDAETGDGGVVNPPLPDYAEPQKGSDAEE